MTPSHFHPSRRSFLASLAASLASVACRVSPYDRGAFGRPDRSPVAILPAADYRIDLAAVLERGLREIGVSASGRSVLLKPNLIESRPAVPVHTDPSLVVAAAEALRALGAASVVVGEGPGHCRDTDFLLEATGLGPLLRAARLPFVDLNHDDVTAVALHSRFTGQRQLVLPKSVLAADLVVSMPKLKTHHWAGMTCAMKNLFGVVPGAVYGWPKNPLHFWGIDNSIVDVAAAVGPALAIVDAVIAMEGDGPLMGAARSVGCVVVGTDLVAVDATCARIMEMEPRRLGYLEAAGRFLGHIDPERIELRGERLERFAAPFEPAPGFGHVTARSRHAGDRTSRLLAKSEQYG